MKTLNKLSDLFHKLDKAEVLIDKYQKSLSVAPFRAVKRALDRTLMIRSILESEIIKISDMVSDELELERINKELESFEDERNTNSYSDFNYLMSLKNKKFQLESDIHAID